MASFVYKIYGETGNLICKGSSQQVRDAMGISYNRFNTIISNAKNNRGRYFVECFDCMKEKWSGGYKRAKGV